MEIFEEQLINFKNKIPIRVKEHIYPMFYFSADTVTLVLSEDETAIFSQAFPLFLFPKTYDYFMSFGTSKQMTDENVYHLFYLFLFEFTKYYNLANEISYSENQSLSVYSSIFNLIDKMYKDFYGKEKEMTPPEICFYSNVILNFSKELLTEIEDEELFDDFHLWLSSFRDINDTPEEQHVQLLTLPTINSTPT